MNYNSNFYKLIVFLVFITISFLIYGNSLNNKFVFDDKSLVVDNDLIKSFKNIPQILGITEGRIPYRPVRNLSYTIDYFFSGLNPLGYHIFNILYHSITVFLIYLIALYLVGNFKIALLSAVFFIVHPIHADAVTYISGRRDILSAIFFFLAFYYFIKFRDSHRKKYITIIIFSYILAVFTKEMAVTLPLVMFCYDYVKEFRSAFKTSFLKELFSTIFRIFKKHRYLYSSLLIFGLWVSYYYIAVLKASHKISWYGGNIFSNFATVSRILAYYIWLLLFPLKLNADYSYNAFSLSESFLEPMVILSVLILFGIFIFSLILLNRKETKIYSFLILFFFITLLPVSHIIPHHELLAEHYLYIPSFSFCLILGMILTKFIENKKFKTIALFLSAVVIIFYSTRIIIRNQDWKDELTFWEKTVQSAPGSVRAHDSLGVVYQKKGEYKKAITEFKKALEIDSQYFRAYYNMGNLYEEISYPDKAINLYEKSLSLNPQDFQSRNNLAQIYVRKGLYDKAIYQIEKAIKIQPKKAKLRSNLASVYNLAGLYQKAVDLYEKALDLDSSLLGAHISLGILYHRQGQLDKAEVEYKKVLQIDYKLVPVRYNLGVIYAAKGNYQKAKDEWEYVLILNPNFSIAVESLRKLQNLGF